MDARSNVALRAIALRGDIEEIEAEATESMTLGTKNSGACPCQVALGRLSHVKAQLRDLRQRCAGDPPAEVEQASNALGMAEKRLPFHCMQSRMRPARDGAKEAA